MASHMTTDRAQETNGAPMHVVDPALYALRLIIDTFDKLEEPERVKVIRTLASWYGYELRQERKPRAGGDE